MMLKPSLSLFICALILAGCANDQTAEIERLKAENAELRAMAVQPIPASLSNFFPPKADGPIWRMQMHAMVTPLMGGVGSVMAGDMTKAAAQFEQFGKEYIGTSKMVPEWSYRFDLALIDSLNQAAASGDPDATMAALGNVANTCHNCHYDNMARVQALFEWPKFADVRVDNPQGGELTLVDVMQGVEGPMIGLGLSLQEGATEQARAQLEAFKQGFSLLEEVCENCHETERTYFVDASVKKLIGRLEKVVSQPSPDAAAAGKLLQNIGEETCFRCHLVHVPAAFIQKKAAMADAAMGTH